MTENEPAVRSVDFAGKKGKTRLLYQRPGHPERAIRFGKLNDDLEEIRDTNILVALWYKVKETFLGDKTSRSGLNSYAMTIIRNLVSEIKRRGITLQPEPNLE